MQNECQEGATAPISVGEVPARPGPGGQIPLETGRITLPDILIAFIAEAAVKEGSKFELILVYFIVMGMRSDAEMCERLGISGLDLDSVYDLEEKLEEGGWL